MCGDPAQNSACLAVRSVKVPDCYAACLQTSSSKCRRLLCLSKLAAHASGNDVNSQHLKAKATTRLRQLALQQQLGLDTGPPLSTAQLVLQALSGGAGVDAADTAVAAVEALALASEQRHSDQYRWENCLCYGGDLLCAVQSSLAPACCPEAAWLLMGVLPRKTPHMVDTSVT